MAPTLPSPHRTWRTALAATVAAAALVVLGSSALSANGDSAVPDHPDAATILHVLNRLGYGARPGDVERVERMGLAAYIDEQLHPERLPDTDVEGRLAPLQTLSMSTHDLAVDYYVPAQQAQRAARAAQAAAEQQMDPSMAGAPARADVPPDVRMAQQKAQVIVNDLTQQKILRAVYSDRQLNEVLVDFWLNHFNVFVGKGQPERLYLTSYERDAIRPHVLGSFRDLLGAVAHSPAMLFYLDNWQSSTPNAPLQVAPQVAERLNDPRLTPAQRQQLADRLQQMRARQKQAPERGINENWARELMELHTLGVNGGYTQQDVINVARAFTGWTIDRPQQGGGFLFNPRMHDMDEKVILGVHFPKGGGEEEGDRVLDILASRPATAHHIAYELAQRFVADEPPASLVDRAAQRFLDTKGDLREVVRTIITSPEFFAAAGRQSEVKTPLDFAVSALRASDADIANAQQVVQILRGQLGMPLYGCVPPTGYATTADTWVNTGALLARMNVSLQLVSNNVRGVRVEATSLVPDVSDQSRAALVQALFAGEVSDTTAKTLARARTPQEMLALALGAPEFQRR